VTLPLTLMDDARYPMPGAPARLGSPLQPLVPSRAVRAPWWVIPLLVVSVVALLAATEWVLLAATVFGCAAALVGNLSAAMVTLFVLMPFQQSVLGETSSLNLCASDFIAFVLMLRLVVALPARGRARVGPPALFLLVFFAVNVLSSALHWDGMATAVSVARMFVSTVGALIVFANLQVSPELMDTCMTAYLWAILGLAACTVAAFITGGVASSMYALGLNKNGLGPTFGCGIVIALGWMMTDASLKAARRRRRWLMLCLLASVVGIMLTLSRGAWVATVAGLLCLLVSTRNTRVIVTSLTFFVPTIVLIWFLLPQDAVDYATNISASSSTIASRLESIDAIMGLFWSQPIIGVGVGLRKYIEPHNVLVLTLGETGIVGLSAFIAVFASALYTFRKAARVCWQDPRGRRVVMVGAAVFVVSIVHGCMDVYWRRGVGYMGWAFVGMAVSLMGRPRPANRVERLPAQQVVR
jgi:O-antigen ligase